LVGIDLIGKHLPGAGFQRLDDDIAVAGSDLKQVPFVWLAKSR